MTTLDFVGDPFLRRNHHPNLPRGLRLYCLWTLSGPLPLVKRVGGPGPPLLRLYLPPEKPLSCHYRHQVAKKTKKEECQLELRPQQKQEKKEKLGLYECWGATQEEVESGSRW